MSVSYNFGNTLFPSSNRNLAVNAAALKSDPARVFPEHVDPPGDSTSTLHCTSYLALAETAEIVQPVQQQPVIESEEAFTAGNSVSLALDAQLEEWERIQRVISAASAHGRTLSVVTVEYRGGSWNLLKRGTGLVLLADASQDSMRVLASQTLELIRGAGTNKLYFCRANYTNIEEYLSHELMIEAVLAMLPRVNLEIYDGEAVANWSAKSPRLHFEQFSIEGVAQARSASLARMIAQRKSQEA